MCCCFSFSFSKHTLDDVCLSLVFKSVLNSVTFDNCGRFWKCAKQKIMYGSSSSHTQKGSMFFRPSPPDISYWDFLIANRKKKIPDNECKVRQQFFTDSDWQTGLIWKGCRFVWVFLKINCPKVLMWSACSESRSFNLSYHTVTVPRSTTVVYCLFSLGEIVSWFS